MSQITLTPVDFNPFQEGKEITKVVFSNEPQKEIWLSCAIGGKESSLAYNESVSLDLKGIFHPEHFSSALQEVIKRHEALRSSVSADGDMLLVYKHLPAAVEEENIVDVTDQTTYLSHFIANQMEQVFDLEEGPLFRLYLHKLSTYHHYFTLVIHHIIGDGWSLGVILEDLSKIYNAKVKGEYLQLEEAPQMSKYAVEQEHFQKSSQYHETEKYWLDMYKNSIPVLDLPTDYPRPSIRTYKAKRFDQHLPVPLVERLKIMGAKAGSSLVNTLLSAFEIFLHLQTNQREIVVGLPAAGQSATENFGLVGHCVNLLPLKSVIDPDSTFLAYLKKRKSEFFDAYDHQNFTFGQLINKLNIVRDHSRVPLVPVIFNIDMGMDDAVAFEKLDFTLISNPRAYETFELFMNATRSKSSFTLEWSYNTQLFKPETIDKMAHDFDQLLHSLVSNPEITISELNIKKNEVWKDQLKTWVNTTAQYPSDSHLSELIAQTANKFPTKTAVVFNKQKLSYKDLIIRSNQFAAYLEEQGIQIGDMIGLASERSLDMLICLLGILKAGAVYVPLDPEYPQERIEYMLEDAKAKLLLISRTYSGQFKTNAKEMIIEDISRALGNYPKTNPGIAVNANDLAYVLYTSGSTGQPKGVKITHRNLVNFLCSMQSQPGVTEDDRLLAITTISFDIAGLELYLPLITGAELIICDNESARDGRLLLDLLKEKKITFMQATPSTWRMIIDSGWSERLPVKILCGGEALPKELAELLLERSNELWNMYGPTETTIWSTIRQITSEDSAITIGYPINNTTVYILNEEQQLLAPGLSGEIYIGGDGVAAGYLNQSALTAERFIRDLFSQSPSAKLYKTGDLGMFLDNGEIRYLGRIDQQVKIRGHRIELGEIESQLVAYAGIQQAVVLAREDTPNNKKLVAYVILTASKTEDITLWKSELGKHLPDYMVPADFVVLKEFPLTPNNKIDKKALPKPASKAKVQDLSSDRPKGKNEILVAQIWSSVLGLTDIPTNANFFELGGQSLLAVKVMAAIESQTGKRLPLATLFENATIAKLARKIQSEEEERWESLVPIKTSGNKPPVFMIHGGGLNILLFKTIADMLDEEQPVYGMQARGLSRPAELLYTIEEIAAVYVREIMDVYPNGPYLLTGYSLGGIIAFEMARQLRNLGKEIKFLGAVDTYAGNLKSVADHTSKITKKVKRQFHKIPFFTKAFIEHPKETFVYQWNYVKNKINKPLPAKIKSQDNYFTPYEQSIMDSYDIAVDNYAMPADNFQLDLFRVNKRIYYIDDQVYLGWDKFAKKGVKIHVVPGDHRTFLHPPNDREFAAILQSALDKAAENESRIN